MSIIYSYCIGINIVAFLCYGEDKRRARLNGNDGGHRPRIAESTLLLLAVLGGSLGAWLGMNIFRHKTHHLKFTILLPLLLLVQIALLVFCHFFGAA